MTVPFGHIFVLLKGGETWKRSIIMQSLQGGALEGGWEPYARIPSIRLLTSPQDQPTSRNSAALRLLAPEGPDEGGDHGLRVRPVHAHAVDPAEWFPGRSTTGPVPEA